MATPISTRGGDDRLDTPAVHAGRADAYDEHRAGTSLDILDQRLDAMVDHVGWANDLYASYILGYSAYVIGVRLEAQQTRRIADEAYVDYLVGGAA